jgi:hypothetical protein
MLREQIALKLVLVSLPPVAALLLRGVVYGIGGCLGRGPGGWLALLVAAVGTVGVDDHGVTALVAHVGAGGRSAGDGVEVVDELVADARADGLACEGVGNAVVEERVLLEGRVDGCGHGDLFRARETGKVLGTR